MSTLAPRATPLVRCNPVTKLAAGFILMFAVLLSVDVVSAGVLLLLELALLPLAGLPWRTVVGRTWFLPIIALTGGWSTALLAEKTGATVVDLGPVLLTADSLTAGAAIGLRTMALALPAVVLLATIDPTDLADGLIQKLRVSERFALAALAAGRLVSLWIAEWQVLRMARRARGVGGSGPLSHLGAFFPVMFALLVQAIRRGTRLAMAMEGRAFGAPGRTWARTSRFAARDLGLLAGALFMAATAVGAAIATGSWNLIV